MYEVPCLDLDGNIVNKFYQWDIDQKIVIDVTGCDERYLSKPPEVHFCNVSRTEALVVRSLKSGYIADGGANVMTSPSTSASYVATLNPGDRIIYSEYTENGGDIGTSYEETREWCSFEYKSEKRYVRTNNIEYDSNIIVADVPNCLLQEAYPLLVYVYLTDANDSSSQKTILFSEVPVRKRAKPSDYLYVDNITRITADMIKNELEASTKKTKEDAISRINSTKENAEATLNKTKESAVNEINQKKEDIKTAIDNSKKGFETTGSNLVKTATEIKDNTQKVYEKALDIANNTKTTIETDINTLILTKGISLKIVNDGNGNVTPCILINK